MVGRVESLCCNWHCLYCSALVHQTLLVHVCSRSVVSANENTKLRGGVTQLVAQQTLLIGQSIMSSNTFKGSCCLLEQDNLPSLLCTCWFHEQIWVWFHNQTEI